MKAEIISLKTAEKLANMDKALKYIDSKLRTAYTEKLSWGAVIELQSVENLLNGKEPIKESKWIQIYMKK